MSTQLIRQAIKTEIERARAAWAGGYSLFIDYENKHNVVLPDQSKPYLAVDIVFMDGAQLDMGPNPVLRADGQIILAAGIRQGLGTDAASALLDYFIPYLQFRDNLLNGVRTEVARPHPPKPANGFYYLPAVINFWCDGVKPATP